MPGEGRVTETGSEEQGALAGVGHQRLGGEEQVAEPDRLGRRHDVPGVLQCVGGGDDVAGGADPAQPGRGGQRVLGVAADEDHLVAPVHGALAPRRVDPSVPLVPVDAQVALAARYLLVDVHPGHAPPWPRPHEAHRTRGRSEAKLGNFGPVQPVQRSPICLGVPQPRYSVLGRQG